MLGGTGASFIKTSEEQREGRSVIMMIFQHFKEWVEFWKTPVEAEMRGNYEQFEWVSNGSVDVKGRPVLKTKSGGRKASVFILILVTCESMAYVSIAFNMIIYLTTVLDEGVATSVKNVNYWIGTTCVLPLLGGFIADVYCGRYKMVLFSSAIYISGLVLLTLSVTLPVLKAHIGVYFCALYMVSFGVGGHKPSVESFGADQFNEEDKSEMLKKISFFNHWFFGLNTGFLIGVTVVVYVQENVSWGFGYGIVTVAMAMGTVLFLYGTPSYRHKVPGGSPITAIAQVVVAAIRKRNITIPSDMSLLYEKDVELLKPGQKLLVHTDNFQFLDKAAIMEQDSSHTQIIQELNPWYVCPVTQVEETKLILKMAPIWFSCLIFAMTVTESISLFVKQGSTMDRNMGPHFRVPSASLLALQPFSALVFVTIFDSCIVPLARRITGNERGVTVFQRIGIGMVFSVLSMATAALIENMRIHVAKTHDLLDRPTIAIPVSVFWLIPQFVLMGLAEVFSVVGLQEYFYDQVPDGMSSLGIGFYLSVLGVSSFLGSLLVTIVQRVTKVKGQPGWLANNLNRSKLDYFYWLLVILGTFNLSCYAYTAKVYTYKKIKQMTSIRTNS